LVVVLKLFVIDIGFQKEYYKKGHKIFSKGSFN